MEAIDESTSIAYLSLVFNQLTSFIALEDRNIQHLDFGINELESIDISELKTLQRLDLSNSFISELDLSSNPELNFLRCNECELEILNIKNGRTQNHLQLESCNQLKYICADNNELAAVSLEIETNNLTGVVLNTYCTFDSAAPSITVDGKTRINASGTDCNANDPGFPYVKYEFITPVGNSILIGDNTGSYNISIPENAETLIAIPSNRDRYNINPASVDLSAYEEGDLVNQDFCITLNEDYEDLSVNIIPLGTVRPGFEQSFLIQYQNLGNSTATGQVRFSFEGDFMDYVSSSEQVSDSNENNLTWEYIDLIPMEEREIKVTFLANTPTDPTPLNQDVILGYEAIITPISADFIKENNRKLIEIRVVNAFDPNDKTCLQGPELDFAKIDDYVDYLIRFENIGTASAVNVVVKDEIDPSLFDISTLEITDASHRMVSRISENIVEFYFEDIYLPFEDEENDGYVAFKIKFNPDLSLGTVFHNQAEIYFDFNEPIITNNYETTLVEKIDFDGDGFNEDEDCDDTNPMVNALSDEIPNNGIDEDCDGSDLIISNTNDLAEKGINVYPNPATDILYLEADKTTLFSGYLTNIMGQKVLSFTEMHTIEISSLEAGTYLVHIINEELADHKVERIVIQ